METLIFFSFLAAVILVPVYLRSRDRTQMYETLRQAFEHGQAAPPELIQALQNPVRPRSTPDHDFRRGLTLSVIGLGVCGIGVMFYYGLWDASPMGAEITAASIAGVGVIPTLLGLAFLALAWWGHRTANGQTEAR
jgi:hypothetical protein